MSLYLTNSTIGADPRVSELVTFLQKAGANTSAIDYLQSTTAPARMSFDTQTSVLGAFGRMAGGARSVGQGLLSAGMSNIRNIGVSRLELPVCQILDGLMNPQKGNYQTQSYLYLDPKAAPSSCRQGHPSFQKAVAFVVGGGSYVEMQQLSEWAQQHGKHVIYGSTDMVSPMQFTEELRRLGQLQSVCRR